MWKLHKRALPLLHRWDRAAPADTCVNLIVVWLKAIAGNRGLEGTSDGGAALAMQTLALARTLALNLTLSLTLALAPSRRGLRDAAPLHAPRRRLAAGLPLPAPPPRQRGPNPSPNPNPNPNLNPNPTLIPNPNPNPKPKPNLNPNLDPISTPTPNLGGAAHGLPRPRGGWP